MSEVCIFIDSSTPNRCSDATQKSPTEASHSKLFLVCSRDLDEYGRNAGASND